MELTAGLIGAKGTRRERSQMHELTELAYTTVFDALKLAYGSDDAHSAKDRKRCDLRAKMAADYLFSREPDPDALETLPVAREQELARDWLKRNDTMRELVLESLRVLNVMDDHAGSRTGPIGEGLVRAYGRGSFKALDHAAYDALVQRAIGSLPLHLQQSIFYGWAKTRSCR